MERRTEKFSICSLYQNRKIMMSIYQKERKTKNLITDSRVCKPAAACLLEKEVQRG